MQILLPKHDTKHIMLPDLPFFYLIGPVRGGGDWQRYCCLTLERQVGECIIATPCRWGPDHALSEYFTGERGSYDRQTFWEQKYIQLALTRRKSCLVAWFPLESNADPRTDGHPYGRDSYGEIGYFRGKLETWPKTLRKKFPLVMGGSPQFHGMDVILANLNYSYGERFPFETTPQALAMRAAQKVME